MHIGIIHYQTNGTDGVSLEIQKRAKVLHGLGHSVSLIDDSVFDFLSLKHTRFINFLDHTTYKSYSLGRAIKKIEADAELSLNKFYSYFRKHIPDLLYVHNLFSLPIIPAASLGLYKAIKRLGIPTIAYDHDFWQTRDYFPYEFKNILQKFPIKSSLVFHITINSLDVEYLKQAGITEYMIRHDYWDDTIVTRPNDTKQKILHKRMVRRLRYKPDLIFLVATRIIPRKGIENAIRFVALFNKLYDYNGVIVFSNPEHKDQDYFARLRHLAVRLRVPVYEARHQSDFWSWYYLADVILYPTYLEGFGNQFLEAMHFGKPLVMFEYPVFKKDIKPKGFSIISLGDKLYPDKATGFFLVPEKQLRSASEQLYRTLMLGPNLQRYKDNKRLLNRYYSTQVLVRHIKEEIERAARLKKTG